MMSVLTATLGGRPGSPGSHESRGCPRRRCAVRSAAATPPTYVHDDDAGPAGLQALLRGISDQIATESTEPAGRNLRPTTLDSYRRIVERVILSKARDCLG
jgi:hypothetical protein